MFGVYYYWLKRNVMKDPKLTNVPWNKYLFSANTKKKLRTKNLAETKQKKSIE